VSKEAIVRTYKWRGYKPLKSQYLALRQEQSKPSQNFKLFYRQVMMVKGWIRGIHHSVTNLQPYLDEFCYRFNRISSFDRIFHNITGRMVNHQPVFTNQLKWSNYISTHKFKKIPLKNGCYLINEFRNLA
jgi:hypothetical protein